jgi:hypothetical protein
MKWYFWVACGGIGALGAAVGAWDVGGGGRGWTRFFDLYVILVTAGCIASLWFTSCVVEVLRPWLRSAAVAGLVFFLLVMPADWVGKWTFDRRMSLTRESVRELVVSIEEFRRSQGRLPKDLDELAGQGVQLPRPLFGVPYSYDVCMDGKSFVISVGPPTADRGHRFHSWDSSWSSWRTGWAQ